MNGDPNNLKRNPPPSAPVTPEDAGSEALAEALRSSFGIIKFVMLALIAVFFVRGFFTVGPQERAIILRLGKPVGEGEKALLGEGWHWTFPYPIDDYKKIPITEIQRVTSSVGWYATTPEQELAGTEPPPGNSLKPGVDGYVLTADGNIVHVRAALYYRISDPIGFVFDFASATNVIQDALNNALICAAARFKVDDILTRDFAGFKDAVRRRASDLLDAQKVGVIVERCDVQPLQPRWLTDAFNRVLQAEVTRSKVLEEARSYENQVLSKAKADAASRLNTAESERALLVKSVGADAERFKELLPQYRANPGLFEQQWLTEVITKVLATAQDKIFLSERADGKARELRLLFNRELPKLKTETSTQP